MLRNPAVLAAADPRYALDLIAARPAATFVALGSVFLAVTGGEALYADMGHFGRRPIRVDWFAIVLPALLLNYAGQAALVLADPAALDQSFFRMVPGWALDPQRSGRDRLLHDPSRTRRRAGDAGGAIAGSGRQPRLRGQ